MRYSPLITYTELQFAVGQTYLTGPQLASFIIHDFDLSAMEV